MRLILVHPREMAENAQGPGKLAVDERTAEVVKCVLVEPPRRAGPAPRLATRVVTV
ncbi:hypothetical protein GCM10022267_83640 [Lentzea roselyniae]|uniref:Transposase n=1 Tax=Lentzea roselyniae TaxID=531940 RepID=A0ABP7CCH2_9PSEU